MLFLALHENLCLSETAPEAKRFQKHRLKNLCHDEIEFRGYNVVYTRYSQNYPALGTLEPDDVGYWVKALKEAGNMGIRCNNHCFLQNKP